METAPMSPEDRAALADEIAERVFGLQYAMVLTKSQAKAMVGKKSDTAFDRWDSEYGPCACGHGRFSREKLLRGLKRESLKNPERKAPK
jgi:hypothetical protein